MSFTSQLIFITCFVSNAFGAADHTNQAENKKCDVFNKQTSRINYRCTGDKSGWGIFCDDHFNPSGKADTCAPDIICPALPNLLAGQDATWQTTLQNNKAWYCETNGNTCYTVYSKQAGSKRNIIKCNSGDEGNRGANFTPVSKKCHFANDIDGKSSNVVIAKWRENHWFVDHWGPFGDNAAVVNFFTANTFLHALAPGKAFTWNMLKYDYKAGWPHSQGNTADWGVGVSEETGDAVEAQVAVQEQPIYHTFKFQDALWLGAILIVGALCVYMLCKKGESSNSSFYSKLENDMELEL